MTKTLDDKISPSKETPDAFAEIDEMKKAGTGQRFDNLDELWGSLEN